MTTVTTVPTYPFDPTGTALSNQVAGEEHILTPMNYQDYYFVVPVYGPFFSDSLIVSHRALDGTVSPLTEGVDYYCTHWFVGASRACSKPVYGSISFLDLQLSGTVTLGYQTLGGSWIVDSTQQAQILSDHLHNPRTTAWEQVSGTPVIFPVIDHQWNLTDLVGLSDVLPKLQAIEDAILQNYDPAALAGHLAAVNPHGITADMLDVYTKEQVNNLVVSDTGSAAMDQHLADANPHPQYPLTADIQFILDAVRMDDELYFLAQS